MSITEFKQLYYVVKFEAKSSLFSLSFKELVAMQF